MLFRSRKKTEARFGLSCTAQNVSIVKVDPGYGERPLVSSLLSCSSETPGAMERLQKATSHRKGQGLCLGVALPGQYQLFQVEPPEVPEEELLGAVRWQIRDLVDIPVEQALVDLVPLPESANQRRMAYVASARPDAFNPMLEMVASLHLSCRHIDIAELALRNLLVRLPQNEQGVACLYLAQHQGLFVVVRQGVLCFARSVGVGTDQFLLSTPDAAATTMDQLVLELQRSLDYYESSISRTTLRSMVVCPMDIELPDFLPKLEQMLSPDVTPLNLHALFEFQEEYNGQELGRCLLALGAALKDGGAL